MPNLGEAPGTSTALTNNEQENESDNVAGDPPVTQGGSRDAPVDKANGNVSSGEPSAPLTSEEPLVPARTTNEEGIPPDQQRSVSQQSSDIQPSIQKDVCYKTIFIGGNPVKYTLDEIENNQELKKFLNNKIKKIPNKLLVHKILNTLHNQLLPHLFKN